MDESLNPYQISIWNDLDEMNNFVPTKEQLDSISRRDYCRCMELGMSQNLYFYMIDPTWRLRLCRKLRLSAI